MNLSNLFLQLLVFVSVTDISVGKSGQRYRNLGNPTSYEYTASEERIVELLMKIQGPESWGPLAGSYDKDKKVYGFGVSDYYTKRYWVGRTESESEIDPPEAGRIGTIQNHFLAHVEAIGKKTLVRIEVEYFEQQVGRKFRIFPHVQKVPVFVEVNSDTYFEYLFLFQLGQRLGETNMPVIKG